jgi:hypothetical protein
MPLWGKGANSRCRCRIDADGDATTALPSALCIPSKKNEAQGLLLNTAGHELGVERLELGRAWAWAVYR